MTIEFKVETEEAGMRLGAFLRRRRVSLSVVRHQKNVAEGLQVNGMPAHTNRTLAAGDAVALNLCFASAFSAAPEELPLKIAYEDAHALVVNKPAGQLTHPATGRHSGTLANAYCHLAWQRGQKGEAGMDRVFRPVGRLDADTSGLVLCAKHAVAAPLLAQTLQKEYLALAQGYLPKAGAFDFCLTAGETPGVRQTVSAQGRPCRTDYRCVAQDGGVSLVRVWPRTGRTHQIRAHFAHAGHPLLGDALYGGAVGDIGRHALHCGGLAFTGLDGNGTAVRAGLPEDMRRLCEALGMDVRAL